MTIRRLQQDLSPVEGGILLKRRESEGDFGLSYRVRARTAKRSRGDLSSPAGPVPSGRFPVGGLVLSSFGSFLGGPEAGCAEGGLAHAEIARER